MSAAVDTMFIGLSAAVNIIICIHMAISCCGYHVHRAVSCCGYVHRVSAAVDIMFIGQSAAMDMFIVCQLLWISCS